MLSERACAGAAADPGGDNMTYDRTCEQPWVCWGRRPIIFNCVPNHCKWLSPYTEPAVRKRRTLTATMCYECLSRSLMLLNPTLVAGSVAPTASVPPERPLLHVSTRPFVPRTHLVRDEGWVRPNPDVQRRANLPSSYWSRQCSPETECAHSTRYVKSV